MHGGKQEVAEVKHSHSPGASTETQQLQYDHIFADDAMKRKPKVRLLKVEV